MTAGNGRYEIKESFYHLEISCRYIAEKFSKPNFGEWTNGDYIRLSSILSRTTSVQISPNTLKRIFGKLKTTERYFPQRATRDALVQYAGYKDWDIFVNAHPKPARTSAETDTFPEESPLLPSLPSAMYAEQVPALSNISDLSSAPAKSMVAQRATAEPDPMQPFPGTNPFQQRKTAGSSQLWYLLAGILIILVTGYVVYRAVGNKPITNFKNGISFTCKNPIGKNPHSAVFKFQLTDEFKGDPNRFSIFFGDGRPEKQIRNAVLQTHYYEIPGRYYAQLRYDGKPIDTIPVFLETDGWTATATVERDSMRVYPVSADSLYTGKFLSVSTNALHHAGVDTNKTFYVDFVNTRPTTIDGDNFQFHCEINTSLERAGVRCSQLMLIIYGEKSFHKVFILKPGCEAWSNLTFSDFYRDGREDDLNFLAADLSQGGKLGLNVKNKNVSLVLNGSEIYTAQYTMPMGKIYGIKVAFSGVGKIHDVQLSDPGSGQIFDEGFLK